LLTGWEVTVCEFGVGWSMEGDGRSSQGNPRLDCQNYSLRLWDLIQQQTSVIPCLVTFILKWAMLLRWRSYAELRPHVMVIYERVKGGMTPRFLRFVAKNFGGKLHLHHRRRHHHHHHQAHTAWQRPPTTRTTTLHVWKTRGWLCSFWLLMMGGVSPEICWASYKYGIIKNFDTLLHLVGFFLVNYMRTVEGKSKIFGSPTVMQREHTVVFPWQHSKILYCWQWHVSTIIISHCSVTWRWWLRERDAVLRYALWREVFLLPQSSGSK
jgi:hypothetical protein